MQDVDQIIDKLVALGGQLTDAARPLAESAIGYTVEGVFYYGVSLLAAGFILLGASVVLWTLASSYFRKIGQGKYDTNRRRHYDGSYDRESLWAAWVFFLVFPAGVCTIAWSVILLNGLNWLKVLSPEGYIALVVIGM